MTKSKSQAAKELSSYELLGMRVQRAIISAQAQASNSALLERCANDVPGDWERLLEAIRENDNVTVIQRDDGLIQLVWTVPWDG